MSYHLRSALCLSFPTPLTPKAKNFAFIPPPHQKSQGIAVISPVTPAWQPGCSSTALPESAHTSTAQGAAVIGSNLLLWGFAAIVLYLCPSQR